MKNIINIVVFNLLWCVSVFGAFYEYYYAGVLALLVSLIINSALGLIKNYLTYGFLAIIGIAAEILFYNISGSYSFIASGPALFGYPIWMMVLWLGFASLFDASLSWVKTSCAFPLGFVSGPVAYIAAEQIGVLTLSNYSSAVLLIAFFWGSVFSVQVYLNKALK